MSRNHEIGRIGEKLALKYLQRNKYIILEKNYRCKQGEIDIIAIENKNIIFVEVKTRTNISFGKPAEAVKYTKKEHIKKVARYYLYTKKIKIEEIRFDIIEIYLGKKKYWINHIKQIM